MTAMAAEALQRLAYLHLAFELSRRLPPDEYYWVDLIGLEVVNREAQALGIVRESDVHRPANCAWSSRPCQDDKPVERMIPFVSAYVDDVGLADAPHPRGLATGLLRRLAMRFDIITLFPELFAPLLTAGITRRAFESRLRWMCNLHNPRDFAVWQLPTGG